MGVPNNKDYRIWGLYRGPPILGNYHLGVTKESLELWAVESFIGLSLLRGDQVRV